jgi:hypothetical protein
MLLVNTKEAEKLRTMAKLGDFKRKAEWAEFDSEDENTKLDNE